MSEWIKCSDRLPDIGVPVWIDGSDQAGIGARCDLNDGTWIWGFAVYSPYWDDLAKSWIVDEYDCDDVSPSRWMPLPEPQTD